MARNKTVYMGYPAYLTCAICGKQIKANSSQIKKSLEKTGKDLETYLNTYICRETKKLLKAYTTLEPVQEINKEVPIINKKEKSFERLQLLKRLNKKVCEQPPEYYQNKFKKQYNLA